MCPEESGRRAVERRPGTRPHRHPYRCGCSARTTTWAWTYIAQLASQPPDMVVRSCSPGPPARWSSEPAGTDLDARRTCSATTASRTSMSPERLAQLNVAGPRRVRPAPLARCTTDEPATTRDSHRRSVTRDRTGARGHRPAGWSPSRGPAEAESRLGTRRGREPRDIPRWRIRQLAGTDPRSRSRCRSHCQPLGSRNAVDGPPRSCFPPIFTTARSCSCSTTSNRSRALRFI